MQVERALATAAPRDVTERFGSYQRLTVRQRKRWLEILLSFEMRNTYDVYDGQQMPVLRVREEGQGLVSFLKRIFLGPLRPFTAAVRDIGTDAPVLTLRRPFRFFFHRIEASSPDGVAIGAVERRWSWLRRVYVIEDAKGSVVADLLGPILHPWTFQIRVGGEQRGSIVKRWSGLLKEAFTDADNFGVDLTGLDDARLKALSFAATVLVDVVHFERGKG